MLFKRADLLLVNGEPSSMEIRIVILNGSLIDIAILVVIITSK